MITLELPYPPSINNYYQPARNGKRGRKIISEAGMMFRTKVKIAILQAGAEPMAGSLVIQIDLYPPDYRTRDIDNILKPLFDALQHGGLLDNDYAFEKLILERFYPTKGGLAIVTIKNRLTTGTQRKN